MSRHSREATADRQSLSCLALALAAEVALRALRHTRYQADHRRLAGMLRRFAKGVCAHPDYGSDSPFSRALGFVPDSENRGAARANPKPKT